MKCLKNTKTGNIIRVEDRQANQMAGSTWEYVPKAEWKALSGVKSEKLEREAEKKVKTISKKAQRRLKMKQSQRSE